RLTEESVMEIAGQAGLDVARLQQDMADAEVISYLQDTQRLARELGINGTPAFVIGNTLVPGAVDGARLRQLIAEARSGG
ncbi:MAG: DsbA family protein, partial [Gammaproteobacteria bacterium]|nr:DsbA family protein [Gammaproteobacteria bacterium]